MRLISVREYSKIKGISRQAVYKQIKAGLLDNFTVNQDNQTMLDISILTEEEQKKFTEFTDNKADNFTANYSKPSKPKTEQLSLEFLQEELKKRDALISSMDSQIIKLQEKNNQLVDELSTVTDKLLAITTEAQALAKNSQYLQAGTIKQQIAGSSSDSNSKPSLFRNIKNWFSSSSTPDSAADRENPPCE